MADLYGDTPERLALREKVAKEREKTEATEREKAIADALERRREDEEEAREAAKAAKAEAENRRIQRKLDEESRAATTEREQRERELLEQGNTAGQELRDQLAVKAKAAEDAEIARHDAEVVRQAEEASVLAREAASRKQRQILVKCSEHDHCTRVITQVIDMRTQELLSEGEPEHVSRLGASPTREILREGYYRALTGGMSPKLPYGDLTQDEMQEVQARYVTDSINQKP